MKIRRISPDERPTTAIPLSAYAFERSPALTGIAAGTGRVNVEVVDDPFIGGGYVLDGDNGRLEAHSGSFRNLRLISPPISEPPLLAAPHRFDPHATAP